MVSPVAKRENDTNAKAYHHFLEQDPLDGWLKLGEPMSPKLQN